MARIEINELLKSRPDLLAKRSETLRRKSRDTVDRRFWAKVQKTDGCWSWTGGLQTNGYGKVNYDGKRMAAHRLSWLLVNGDLPSDLYVLHRCDNPLCVRPDHLFLGTPEENMHDMIAKGRHDFSGLEMGRHRSRSVCR